MCSAVITLGLMHFHAEKIVVRTKRCDLRRGRAHAEADLQHAWRRAAEHAAPVRLLRRVRHDEARTEFVHRAALTGGDAARPRDEAADTAVVQGVVRGGFSAHGLAFGFVARSRREFVRQAGVVWIVDHLRYCLSGRGPYGMRRARPPLLQKSRLQGGGSCGIPLKTQPEGGAGVASARKVAQPKRVRPDSRRAAMPSKIH